MSQFTDEVKHRLQSAQGNDDSDMILKAYRLGYIDGLRMVFLADNLPRPFRNWLDRYFTRCDGWKQFDSLEQAPPKVSAYRETITANTPLLSLNDLGNLPCRKCRTSAQVEKVVRQRIIKDAILETLRNNGGSMSKDDLYQTMDVETDEE